MNTRTRRAAIDDVFSHLGPCDSEDQNFVKYLYTGCLNIISYCLDELLKMYVLGDQLDTPKLLDATFELIFNCTNISTKAYSVE